MEPPSSSPMRVLIRPSTSAITPTSSSSSTSSTTPLPPQNPASIRLSSFSSSTSSSTSPSSSSSFSSSQSSSTLPSSDGVIVVGFIGRNSDDLTQLINRTLDANIFGSGNLDMKLSLDSRRVSKNEGEQEKPGKTDFSWNRNISYYHDQDRGIVYLQYSSYHFTLSEGMSLFKDGHGEVSLDSILDDIECEDIKGMLVMFSVCHIIIYLHEGSRFDTQILKRLRMLQAAKQALSPFVKSHILPKLTSKASSSSSSQQTVPSTSSNSPPPSKGGSVASRHAAAISLMSGSSSSPALFPGQCTPVVLFVFLDDFSDTPSLTSRVEDLADSTLSNQSSTINSILKPTLSTKSSASVVMLARPVSKSEGNFRKKLQSSLEAQIRFLIKKCRVLGGTEANHSSSRAAVQLNCPPLFCLDASRAVALVDRSLNSKGESLDFVSGLVEEILNTNRGPETLLLDNHYQNLNKDDIQLIKEFIYRQSEALRGRGSLATNTNSGSAGGVGMVAVAAAAAAASAASGKPLNVPPELPSLEDWICCSRLFVESLVTRPEHPDETRILENISMTGKEAIEAAKYLLDSGRGLNMKFSTSWCQKAFPMARELYLKDLPACYPTALHNMQLDKALRGFQSMVKGPAVHLFTKKLEEECISIWKSGRQLCDAISLTGRPCVHQRHEGEGKPHSSGYVFLHACACGRLRRFRDDPFDFESANTIFNCFPNCENLLPALQLPKSGNSKPVQTSSWRVIRVGGARYYEPSKGLLMSGFCSKEKFLSSWRIMLEKGKELNGLHKGTSQKGSMMKLNPDSKLFFNTDDEKKKVQTGAENQMKHLENIHSDDQKINFGKGLPLFTLKKPFSEVVAGSVASDSAFPPLQQMKRTIPASEKGNKRVLREQVEDKVNVMGNCREYQMNVGGSIKDTPDSVLREIDPFLKIGSNVIPVDVNDYGKILHDASLKHVEVYVGFEHECSYGHRFLLTPELLDELGSFSLSEGSTINTVENYDKEPGDFLSSNKNGLALKVQELNHNVQSQSVKDTGCSLQHGSLHDGGSAYSLLNRNLPIYMRCPYCENSKNKEANHNIKFASTISQLQRIFLVTPPFPVVLATCPLVQFEDSSLHPLVLDRERQSCFSIGCQVILPPESFLTLRLPFVYGVQLESGALHPLNHLENKPELTAWITKGSTLQVVSKGLNSTADIDM
ncbi:hypothetical protein H6P81_009494 [Aristolochia fimbriata]|uniref:Nonsense-mediated mRNA decay factor SMG8 n=1 Tax=Aristolochia fimbriata TaxID=158543 RepID=A0AAV7EM88_ARIFI|nr:hypothetical protein H6P81_009494 [Aristolochia fimbriata]